MFSLAIFRPRPRPRPQPQMPMDPWNWTKETVLEFLNALNPKKAADRQLVRSRLEVLERAMLAETIDPNTTVAAVLRADQQTLPIQLRAYRELYEYMLVWLK